MKAIVSFIFFIFITTLTFAQGAQENEKAQTFAAGVELNIEINQDELKGNEVARLYMFKNSRVKKALKFRTKRNASKIA